MALSSPVPDASAPDRATSVLFIIPPYFNLSDYLNREKQAVLPAFTIPYGLLSLNAYLRDHSQKPCDIRILDLNIDLKTLLNGETDQDWDTLFRQRIAEECTSFKPDIVGISALFNSSFQYLEENALEVKRHNPDTLVVAGGGLPSAAYGKILATCPSIDAICKGEGEKPLQALIEAEDRDALFLDHPAWIDRQGLEGGKTPALDFVQDLDDIPPMDYDLISLDDYQCRSIDKRYAEEGGLEMSIHTSRGCPFLCVFCSNPSLHGRAVRTMSVERVVSDVRRMRDEFGMKVLLMEDDHFFNDVDRAKDLLRALSDLDIRIEFPNGVAVYAIDDEVAELFAKSGVSSVALAVESGSDHVLNHIIKKPLKKKLINPAVEHLRRHGVLSHVFIVIGLPGEMDEHRDETLEMLQTCGFDWVHIYCAMPIFGSRLYDICVEKGYITDGLAEDFVATKSQIRAPGVDPEKIQEWAYHINMMVNFIKNHNMKIGNFKVAEQYFRNVCTKYPDHLFGQLFLAEALDVQNKPGASKHRQLAFEIYEKDTFWQDKVESYRGFSPLLQSLFPAKELCG